MRGQSLAYTVTLPPGWTIKRGVKSFDVLAARKSLYIGVIAEEISGGTPEGIAVFVRKNLEASAKNLHWGKSSELLVDGRTWIKLLPRPIWVIYRSRTNSTVYRGRRERSRL